MDSLRKGSLCKYAIVLGEVSFSLGTSPKVMNFIYFSFEVITKCSDLAIRDSICKAFHMHQ